jgi:cytochrome bd-type quinol oxidase subunit 1
MSKQGMSNTGPGLMVLGAALFALYALVFFIRSFMGSGFELGVDTLNGVTKDQLNALNPGIYAYITHLHVAVSGFIASTAIAVGAVAWYSVRKGEWWGWLTAVIAPVLALAVALPLHYTGGFQVDWVAHLGPIYAATVIYVAGALLALKAMLA